jgi:uncharacterized metal-binding protein YceD (DUF177 family)
VSEGFPIAVPYELGRLSQAGDSVTISPTAEERQRIARWAGVDAVESLRAAIGLRKIAPTRFSCEIEMTADVVQSCVVTLEPVRTHIARTFTRELLLTPAAPRHHGETEIEVAPVEDDGREEIASLRYDLAVPVLEELALSIDPYPRSPGVAFEPPADDRDTAERPFSALKGLKIGSKS